MPRWDRSLQALFYLVMIASKVAPNVSCFLAFIPLSSPIPYWTGWHVWPIGLWRNYGIWLTRLDLERHCGFLLTFSWLIHSEGTQTPCCEDTQAQQPARGLSEPTKETWPWKYLLCFHFRSIWIWIIFSSSYELLEFSNLQSMSPEKLPMDTDVTQNFDSSIIDRWNMKIT